MRRRCAPTATHPEARHRPMLNTPLAAAYRSLVPLRLRAPLWHFRSASRAYFSAGRWAYREQLFDFYKSVGKFRPVVQLPVGLRLTVDLRDEGVGRPIFLNEQYEPAETLFLTQELRQGGVFVDIGANIGYFTTLASRLVGPGGRVIAFEPDPDHCELLRRNLQLNAACNVIVRNEALGDERQTGRLFRSESNFGDHRVAAGGELRASIPIAINRFDRASEELRLARVDFIKIDVQGYEPRVIAGMGDSLERLGVRTVLMEFWPYGIRYAGSCPAALVETLLAMNFVLHELDESGQAIAVDPRMMLKRVEDMNAERPLTFVNLVLRKRGIR